MNLEEIKGEGRELHSFVPLINWKHHPRQNSWRFYSSVPVDTELSLDQMLVYGWLVGTIWVYKLEEEIKEDEGKDTKEL